MKINTILESCLGGVIWVTSPGIWLCNLHRFQQHNLEKLPSDPWVVLLLFLIAGHLPPTSHTGNLKLPTRLVLFLLATLQVHRSQLIMHHSSQIGCAGTNPTILPLGMAFGHTIVGPSASEKLSTPLRCYAYWYDLA